MPIRRPICPTCQTRTGLARVTPGPSPLLRRHRRLIKSYLVAFINVCNFKCKVWIRSGWGRSGIFYMIYKGVEFSVTAVAPGIWNWQFRIGDRVIAGKTEAKLNLLAIRRVQLRIDRELKKAEREQPASPDPSAGRTSEKS